MSTLLTLHYTLCLYLTKKTVRRPGAGKGRELLDTGDDLASTLVNSTLWLEADVLSLTGYAMRTLPTSITDARTSVNGETVPHACSHTLLGPALKSGRGLSWMHLAAACLVMACMRDWHCMHNSTIF